MNMTYYKRQNRALKKKIRGLEEEIIRLKNVGADLIQDIEAELEEVKTANKPKPRKTKT